MSDEKISLKDLILKSNMLKKAFVPAPLEKEAGAMPMDPTMMAGGSGMPPMPPDPSMAPGGAMPPIPPDPSMMPGGAMPSDPSMMPPPPPAEAPEDPMNEVMGIVSQMAEGMDKIESKQEALDQKYQDVMAQFSAMQGKIDMLIQILEGKKVSM